MFLFDDDWPSIAGRDGDAQHAGALMDAPPLHLEDVRLVRNATTILDGVTLTVEPGRRWLVLGANGSGKTSLLRIAALYEHPTSGVVEVLGERLGRTDVRELRRRVGYASAALADQLRPELSALDAVRTARHAALEPWWHRYTADDDRHALDCLDRLGVARFAGRPLATLSSGERQRVLLARTLMNDPAIILLDEPSARLDLGGREQLVAALEQLATDVDAPPLVLVTHHVDDIPPSTTDVLLLRDGVVLATGPIEATLTAEALSECFGVSLRLERRASGRYSAWSDIEHDAAQ
jgi:iron complex transport system ATP-binding protein